MNQLNKNPTVAERIRTAQALVKSDRASVLDTLNEIFHEGKPPTSLLNGRYAGRVKSKNSCKSSGIGYAGIAWA
jgi:hypothetical protein